MPPLLRASCRRKWPATHTPQVYPSTIVGSAGDANSRERPHLTAAIECTGGLKGVTKELHEAQCDLSLEKLRGPGYSHFDDRACSNAARAAARRCTSRALLFTSVAMRQVEGIYLMVRAAHVDGPVGHCGRGIHPGACGVAPQLSSGRGVQRIDIVVAGAGIDYLVGHSGRGIHGACGVALQLSPGRGVQRVDVIVVGADIDHSIRHERQVNSQQRRQ